MMEEVRNGAILKYREAKFGDRKYFEQITVLDDFSEDENEAFEKFKETGEVDFDLLHGSVGGVTEKGGSEGE
jgi:hypothetical protein